MSGIVRPYRGTQPRLASGVYLAPTARSSATVEIGEDSSVWYGAVLRGDVGKITIGQRTPTCRISPASICRSGSRTPRLADDVTIGHHATIHGATVGAGALIGIGSIILDNAVIGSEAWVGAGALVPAGMVVPPRVLVLGQPARRVRDLTEEECLLGRKLAERYVGVAREHAAVDAAAPEAR